MAYSRQMQDSNLYSFYFAPRGNRRMADLGMQLSQMYLSPFDHIIGIIGDAGAGKSLLIKGMFPGLDLTNDDEGVNVRPLPLLHEDLSDPFSPHTYHLDIRFESAFTQMHVLADAILEAARYGKMVIVEHFELIHPFLNRNADLLVGIGEEIIITRPNMFGPLPGAAEHDGNQIFSYIVKIALHSAKDHGSYVESPLCFQIRREEIQTFPHASGTGKDLGDICLVILIFFSHLPHGRHHAFFYDAHSRHMLF